MCMMPRASFGQQLKLAEGSKSIISSGKYLRKEDRGETDQQRKGQKERISLLPLVVHIFVWTRYFVLMCGFRIDGKDLFPFLSFIYECTAKARMINGSHFFNENCCFHLVVSKYAGLQLLTPKPPWLAFGCFVRG